MLPLRELRLVHHTTDADFSRGQRNDPEPFVFQSHDDRIAARFAWVEPNAVEMAEQGELFQAGMDEADALLVAGEIAASTGVDEKAGVKKVGPAGVVTRLNADQVRGTVVEFSDSMALADFRAGLLRVLQEEMVEFGAFNLKRRRFPGETAIAKNQFQTFGPVANMKLRPGL